jgi:hypothetical protein
VRFPVGLRFALHSKATPVLEGCQSHQASERPAKVTLTAKPQKGADLGNGFIAGGKQRLSFGNPEALQIIEEGLARDLPEEFHELNLAHGAEPGCCGRVDNFTVVLVDELKEGAETLQILLSAFESVMHSHVVVVVLKQEQEQHP